MTYRTLRWLIILGGGALLALAAAASLTSRAPALRERLVRTLSERLDSEVELRAFHVSTFPVLRAEGEGLVLRHKGRTDVPPLIEIERFHVDGGLRGLFGRPRRVRTVSVTGLRITIPPDGLRTDEAEDRRPLDPSAILVDRIVSRDAQLVFVPREQGREPRVFHLHALTIESAGFDRPLPFEATLTNPVPRGRIEASGVFGPWNPEQPARTPVAGRYTFSEADLSTIRGIAGILSSEGLFEGPLERIEVRGTTDTPDFQVDVGGAPVPLRTRFHAFVDGSDGDTILESVEASFLDTALVAKGGVTSRPGVKGRTVALDVRIEEGRIEDLLRLAVDAPEPLMTGGATLETRLRLPPGAGRVADRLELDGRFGVSRALFTGRAAQDQLAELSRRGQAKDEGEDVGRVVSDMGGGFRLAAGELTFPDLRFSVPGASVRVTGTYALRSRELDFRGALRLQASLSEAAGGGVRSFLLRAVDPLFRTKDAGAELPIKITGTHDDPDFGVDVVRALVPGR